MWLGTVEGQPVASTAMYLRSIKHPDHDTMIPIGYWAHLFVLPEHRKLMLYPQLVFAMRKAMGELGIEAILTATRRPNVVEGHLKLGFKLVCVLSVFVKPLKPFTLLAKHKGNKLAAAVAPIGDALWRTRQSLRRRGNDAIQTMPVAQAREDQVLLAEIIDLLSHVADGKMVTAWTPELLHARLGGSVDGEPYTLALSRRDDTLVGVAMYCMATRGNGIRTGVLLELAARDQEAYVLRGLADRCEAESARAGAEAMLWLDGAGQETSVTLRKIGYRVAGDESYRLIAFTPPESELMLHQGGRPWRFTFLDHDAF